MTILTIYAAGYDPVTGTVICFGAGTLIETDRGGIAVEHLRIGDLVRTLDHGLRPIRWIGGRRISAREMALHPDIRPIRIRGGALGLGMPRADLLVSPQHRILVRSQVVLRMFGEPEALIGAKHLTGLNGIAIATDITEITYWHFLLDRHEVVFPNGTASESLFTGPQAINSVPTESRAEILRLFPDLDRPGPADPQPARDLVKGRQARHFVSRIVKNQKPALASMPRPRVCQGNISGQA
ncbi:MAG: Hint domain-containing protein [Paracoccus sp. (in: a-proteobacteria)]